MPSMLRLLPFTLLAAPYCLFAQASLAPAAASAPRCSRYAPANTPADKALSAGDAAAAQQLFAAQLAAGPSVAGYIGLVDAQLDQDQVSAAAETAQKAVTAFPTSADALALTGDTLRRAGQIPEAAAAYTRALALDICSHRAHLGLGELDQLAARHASAMRELTMAHKLAPSSPQVTVAYLQTLPAEQRGSLLRAFLAEKPDLPPAQLRSLSTESANLSEHRLCQPEQPVTNASFELLPVFLTGRVTRSWGLRIAINGADLPLLELDSSAAGIILNPADAARANVQPVSAASATAPYAAIAGRIRIGSVDYHGCPVTVVPAAQLAGANSLIGTSFFRDNLIHIDYPAHALTLSTLPAPAVSGQFGLTDPPATPIPGLTPVYVANDQLLLPTMINKRGPFLFALDTGLNTSVYSPAVTHKVLAAISDDNSRLIGFSGGIVKVIPRDGGDTDRTQVRGADGSLLHIDTPIKFPVLRYAAVEMPDPYVVSFDLTPFSHAAGTEVSALFGFHLLSYFNIEMNYRDGLVKLVYDQNRRYHVMQAQLHSN